MQIVLSISIQAMREILKKTPREFSGGYYMCHDVFCRKPCISWQLLTEAKPTKKYSKMSDSV